MQDTPAQQELARAQLGWEPWSGPLYPGQGSRAAAKGPALAGITVEIQAQLGGIGLSLVAQNEELLYGRVSGIQVRAVIGIARQTLELAVQQIQVSPCLTKDRQQPFAGFLSALADHFRDLAKAQLY